MSKFYQNYSVTSSDIVTICISMQSHNISTDPVLLNILNIRFYFQYFCLIRKFIFAAISYFLRAIVFRIQPVPVWMLKCWRMPNAPGFRNSLKLYPHTRQEKNHALFPRKNLFISLHHFSNFTLINKTTILLHKYLKINLCYIRTILLANDLTMFDPFFHLPVNICLL